MTNTKKYVSLDKLGLYDEKIKKVISDGDAAALANAKQYFEDNADRFDTAGSAATAKAEAIAYADGKDAAIQAAQAAAEAAAAAAGVADGKAVAAQGEVDALEAYVGTIPAESEATNVVAYVQERTAGIATEGAMTELGNRVGVVEGKVATIEGDYLKAADKTELEGKITEANTAVETEKARAEGIEAGLRTDVDVIKGDYLKAADKTELQGNIDTVVGDVADIVADYLKAADKTELEGKIDAKVAQTDYDTKMGEIDETTESLQTQINTIMSNPDAEGAINSINEFTAYVAEHGTIADGFRADIDKNKGDISAMDAAYKAADTAIVGRLDALEAIDHEAYIAADTALKNELDGDIADLAAAIEAAKTDASNKDAVVLAEAQKATAAVQTALDEAVADLEGADTAITGRLDAIEAQLGDGEGSVADMIAEAQAAAEATAAADATAKANAAEAAAKGHADGLNSTMDARVQALEAIDHDHSNKAELDLIASGDKAKWDAAAAIAHEHGNKTVLDGITAENITTWNTVTSKAAQDDLTAVSDRVGILESWHENFVECSQEDINGLFA